jgi:hypothetical protein
MNARMNVLFTDDLQRELVNVADSTHLYDQAGQPPYTIDSYCADHVVPQGYELLRISSHTRISEASGSPSPCQTERCSMKASSTTTR